MYALVRIVDNQPTGWIIATSLEEIRGRSLPEDLPAVEELIEQFPRIPGIPVTHNNGQLWLLDDTRLSLWESPAFK